MARRRRRRPAGKRGGAPQAPAAGPPGDHTGPRGHWVAAGIRRLLPRRAAARSGRSRCERRGGLGGRRSRHRARGASGAAPRAPLGRRQSLRAAQRPGPVSAAKPPRERRAHSPGASRPCETERKARGVRSGHLALFSPICRAFCIGPVEERAWTGPRPGIDPRHRPGPRPTSTPDARWRPALSAWTVHGQGPSGTPARYSTERTSGTMARRCTKSPANRTKAGDGIRTRDLPLTRRLLWPAELLRRGYTRE